MGGPGLCCQSRAATSLITGIRSAVHDRDRELFDPFGGRDGPQRAETLASLVHAASTASAMAPVFAVVVLDTTTMQRSSSG
jgi:hypothetical protein